MPLLPCNTRAVKCYQGNIVVGTVAHAWYPIMHTRLSLSVQRCHTLAKQHLLPASQDVRMSNGLQLAKNCFRCLFRLMLAWSFESRLADISHLAKRSAAEATVRGCTAQGVYKPGWLNIDTSACLAP